MDEQIPVTQEPPKKPRGWPKGKPRGPRKPVEAPQTPVPPQPTPAPTPPAPSPPEPTAYEPVRVKAAFVNGAAVDFKATDFEVQNGRYSFISYPAIRGFKTVTVLRFDQLAMLEITAPEPMMEKLKAAQAPDPPVFMPSPASLPAGTPSGPPIVYGPPLQRPPYDGGDPRRSVPFKDTRAEHASTLPNPAGIPMAQLSKGEDGVPDRTLATMG